MSIEDQFRTLPKQQRTSLKNVHKLRLFCKFDKELWPWRSFSLELITPQPLGKTSCLVLKQDFNWLDFNFQTLIKFNQEKESGGEGVLILCQLIAVVCFSAPQGRSSHSFYWSWQKLSVRPCVHPSIFFIALNVQQNLDYLDQQGLDLSKYFLSRKWLELTFY